MLFGRERVAVTFLYLRTESQVRADCRFPSCFWTKIEFNYSPTILLLIDYSVNLQKYSILRVCLNCAYGMWYALLNAMINLKASPCIWMLWAGREKEVLSSVCCSFHRILFTSTLLKPKLFARNSVKLEHKVVLSFFEICACISLKDVQRLSKCDAHDWLMWGYFSPFCSNFSSSHSGCSSRAEKLCWRSWGQLCWQRSRGKHYLHYSRLERIYVQYLAFGAHA